MCDTWWPAVLGEMNSRPAISALVRPSPSSRSTSTSRADSCPTRSSRRRPRVVPQLSQQCRSLVPFVPRPARSGERRARCVPPRSPHSDRERAGPGRGRAGSGPRPAPCRGARTGPPHSRGTAALRPGRRPPRSGRGRGRRRPAPAPRPAPRRPRSPARRPPRWRRRRRRRRASPGPAGPGRRPPTGSPRPAGAASPRGPRRRRLVLRAPGAARRGSDGPAVSLGARQHLLGLLEPTLAHQEVGQSRAGVDAASVGPVLLREPESSRQLAFGVLEPPARDQGLGTAAGAEAQHGELPALVRRFAEQTVPLPEAVEVPGLVTGRQERAAQLPGSPGQGVAAERRGHRLVEPGQARLDGAGADLRQPEPAQGRDLEVGVSQPARDLEGRLRVAPRLDRIAARVRTAPAPPGHGRAPAGRSRLAREASPLRRLGCAPDLELMGDPQRHLGGGPVVARPPNPA